MFKPLKLLFDRVETHGTDSDTTLFTELLYVGEFIIKTTASAMVALVQNDRDGHRYRLLHALVRADGVGEWAAVIDQTLTGQASQLLVSRALDMRRTFTERSAPGSWQDQAVKALYSVLATIYPEASQPAERPQLRSWFTIFAELRNKTRGHGAMTPATASRLVVPLNNAIRLMADNNPIFNVPWAYLHRNLSGKYRVVLLGGEESIFAELKTARDENADHLASGIYIYVDGYQRVELLHTDTDVTDFFVPNGAFRNSSYELHSLISDNRHRTDATAYLLPATDRPASETAGIGALEAHGNVFSNLPPSPKGYVRRTNLEKEIKDTLLNDRHPIVTLVGRGGIGKTSAALAVLHDLAFLDKFDVILWFSARDIDLTMSGPKAVRPQVLTENEIAKEYLELIGHRDDHKKVAPATILAGHMTSSPLGKTLLVFDNFETVRSPIDLFNWIDTNIRLPNKVVITSRFRDFKADYPISVTGMEDGEASILVDKTITSLGIEGKLSSYQIRELISEADGHPYIIKIMLGEIANNGKYSKPSMLIARKDDILDALFERTYANLSPLASRAFLVLCSWRSLVPQLALEATLMRQGEEAVDPETAIEQLVRTSLIERLTAADGSDFLEVPLTAATFGKRKLEVSPSRAIIENDVLFLQDVGTTTVAGLKEGLAPKIDALFRRVARKTAIDPTALQDFRPVLEFLSNHYKRAWILLADLEAETGNQENAAEALRRYLASQPDQQLAQKAWNKLMGLYRESGDVIAACGAFLRASAIVEPHFSEVSMIANWLNNSADAWSHLHTTERATIFGPLAKMMEDGLSDADATDISRVSWLYLHMGNEERAKDLTREGLRRDPSNIYCLRLRVKLFGH